MSDKSTFLYDKVVEIQLFQVPTNSNYPPTQQPLPAPNQMPSGSLKQAAAVAQFQQQRQHLALQRQNSTPAAMMGNIAMNPSGPTSHSFSRITPPNNNSMFQHPQPTSYSANNPSVGGNQLVTSHGHPSGHSAMGVTPNMMHSAAAAAAAGMQANSAAGSHVSNTNIQSPAGLLPPNGMQPQHHQFHHQTQQQQQQQFISSMNQQSNQQQQQQQSVRSPAASVNTFNYQNPSNQAPKSGTPGASSNAAMVLASPNQVQLVGSPSAVPVCSSSVNASMMSIMSANNGADVKLSSVSALASKNDVINNNSVAEKIQTPPKNEDLRLMFPQEKQILIEPFQIDHEKGRITRTFFISEAMINKLRNPQTRFVFVSPF